MVLVFRGVFWCFGVQVFRSSGVWDLWFRCLGVQVFEVNDILEGPKGDQGGSQK